VDPAGSDFTIQVVKISHDHSDCTRPALPSFNVHNETVTFVLHESLGFHGGSLALWRSNFEQEKTILFEKQPDAPVVNGKVTIRVAIGDYFTISTVRTAAKGSHGPPPASEPAFPVPYAADFEGVGEGQEAPLFMQQIGAFEVHPEVGNATNHVVRQMVPELPIGWSDHGSNGPMTLIGMREWQDITVTIDFQLPSAQASACVAARVDQMWKQGIVVCVSWTGHWNLTIGGPPQNGVYSTPPIATGTAKPPLGDWHQLALTTLQATATATLDGESLCHQVDIRDIDTGFAAMGTNLWVPTQFDNFQVHPAEGSAPRWNPAGLVPKSCAAVDQAKLSAGTQLRVRDCQPNGIAALDQAFELLSDWQLRHIPSGLCAGAASAAKGATVVLQSCDFSSKLQMFKNDYTRIRNALEPLTLVANSGLGLSGAWDGGAVTVEEAGVKGRFAKWSAFPNTNQLRSSYTASDNSEYPLCLSTCPL